MNEQTAAVDVPQEVVSKPRTVGSALDDAGDVRHDEGNAVVNIDDAEVGIERREVIVCDLRMCVRGDRKERGFADVREADKSHIRKELQFENDLVLLTGESSLCKARDLTGRRGKMLVAPAAAAALAENIVLGGGHVLDDLVRLGVADDRAARHLDDEILAALALAARAAPVLTVRRGILSLIAEVHQRGEIVIHAQDD